MFPKVRTVLAFDAMQKYFFIFDFDYTLLDTGALRAAISRASEAQGVPAESFTAWYRGRPMSRDDWYMNFPLEQISEQFPQADLARLRRGLELLAFSSSEFLYPDTQGALLRLRKAGHELAICTYGEREFQSQKVRHANLGHLFSEVRVTRDVEKAHDVEELCAEAHSRLGHTRTFFVEDNPMALAAAKIRCPHVITVLIQRIEGGIYAEFEEQRPYIDHIVKNMEGVEYVVQTYLGDGEHSTPMDAVQKNSWKLSRLAKILKKK